MGFVVWGLGFGVCGLGFGVWGWGSGIRYWNMGYGVWRLGFRFQGLGLEEPAQILRTLRAHPGTVDDPWLILHGGVNMAHIRQSRPDSGLGFQDIVHNTIWGLGFGVCGLGLGCGVWGVGGGSRV
jgi:hypothetical protein